MFDTDVRVFTPIKAGSRHMEPGPILGVALSTVPVDKLPGDQQLTILGAYAGFVSHYQAKTFRAMAGVVATMRSQGVDHESACEFAAAEIRCELHLTRRAADAELSLALALVERLPDVLDALESGHIDRRRAAVIVRGTDHLDDDGARSAAQAILQEAGGLTTGQVAARLKRLCIEANPEDARDRYESAVEERRVVMEPTVSGTANLLGLDLPPDRVAAIRDRINQCAQSLRGSGETRTIDQLRADVMLDLLEGRTHGKQHRRGIVDLHVDLDTLALLKDHPGDLGGYGPVIADIARRVAAENPDAEWRFTVSDPATGERLTNGITRRRPTARQRRNVETRTPTCVFPGCRMPAARSDLDHTTPHSQRGPTEPDNLAPLCRHDHRIRHEAGWSYAQTTSSDWQWTTRLGRSHTTSGRSP